MMKRLTLRTAAIAGLALAASMVAGPSSAMLEVPFYNYFYFSDATYTTMVGYEIGTCFHGEAAVHPMVGTGSAYYIQERAGVCRDGMIIYE
jgi:hypothetical protein